MELIIFLIPIITVIIILSVSKLRKETEIWEYLVILIPSVFMFFLTKFIMVYANSQSIEYHGDLVNTITYYEGWDETVMVTHTRRVPVGMINGHMRYRTETYVRPERRYHPEQFEIITINNRSISVSKAEFKHIIKQLKVKPVFNDMNRDYRNIDGDAYVYTWDKSKENSYAITTDHLYTNKVKASSYSIFKYAKLTDKDIQDNKLFKYPEIIYHDQNPILGYNAKPIDNQYIRHINGARGKKNEFRMFILCFDNPSLEVAEMQKAYWYGGNKNEFVVCLGIKNDSVIWCNPFSWCDKPILEVKTRDYFINNPKVDFKKFAEYIDKEIDSSWKRKSFEDFSYLSVELSQTQYIVLFVIILLYNILISIWVITNEYKPKN